MVVSITKNGNFSVYIHNQIHLHRKHILGFYLIFLSKYEWIGIQRKKHFLFSKRKKYGKCITLNYSIIIGGLSNLKNLKIYVNVFRIVIQIKWVDYNAISCKFICWKGISASGYLFSTRSSINAKVVELIVTLWKNWLHYID